MRVCVVTYFLNGNGPESLFDTCAIVDTRYAVACWIVPPTFVLNLLMQYVCLVCAACVVAFDVKLFINMRIGWVE